MSTASVSTDDKDTAVRGPTLDNWTDWTELAEEYQASAPKPAKADDQEDFDKFRKEQEKVPTILHCFI
ncbi:hypothetical protein BGX29_008254 [Mortierella sp. GBA35]|nr:hypothetical protein BGX29_008254 [Mortierella sp. GBA35]